MLKRWSREWSLREQYRRAGGEQTCHLNVNDVLIMKDENKNRNLWNHGIVTKLIKGKD